MLEELLHVGLTDNALPSVQYHNNLRNIFRYYSSSEIICYVCNSAFVVVVGRTLLSYNVVGSVLHLE